MMMPWNAGKDRTPLRAIGDPGGENRALSAKMICRNGNSAGHQFSREAAIRKELFLAERSRNVYENKGPLWKSRERSWNVYEKTALSCKSRQCC
jgi:hypothetical protein